MSNDRLSIPLDVALLLSCGGEIIILETEALTAVDVNTGNFKIHDGDNSKFIYDLNYEACKEIARQINIYSYKISFLIRDIIK